MSSLMLKLEQSLPCEFLHDDSRRFQQCPCSSTTYLVSFLLMTIDVFIDAVAGAQFIDLPFAEHFIK
jgi:hypothetical protein